MNRELCARLPWLTFTPLGRPVEPEVYWRKARSDGSGSRGFQSSSSGAANASVPSHSTSRARDAAPRAGSSRSRTRPSSGESVSTKAGSALAAMAASRGICRSFVGGYAGTAMTPAYMQPKKAATYSSPGG